MAFAAARFAGGALVASAIHDVADAPACPAYFQIIDCAWSHRPARRESLRRPAAWGFAFACA